VKNPVYGVLLLLVPVLLFCAAFPVLAGEAVSPCDLFTRPDAEGLFGCLVSEGVFRVATSPAGGSCRYSYEKESNVYGITVRVANTVSITDEGIYDSAKDVFDRQVRARKASEKASKKFREIKDLGDGAFWEGTSLWMLFEDSLVIIKVSSFLPGSFSGQEQMDSAREEQDLSLSLKATEAILPRLNK
jgi:hypothetical protein